MNTPECITCLITETCPDHPLSRTEGKKRGTVCSFRKGHVLCHQELPSSGVFYILEGVVKVFTIEDNGKEIIHALLRNNEFVGIHSVFAHETSPYTAEVLEDAKLCYLDQHVFKDLILGHPSLMDLLMVKMAQTLDEAYHRAGTLIQLGVRERMARCLLDLAEQFGDPETAGTRIRLRLNREELASILGVAPETAIRFLSEFKKKNYITEIDRQIIIHDQSVLLQLCQKEPT